MKTRADHRHARLRKPLSRVVALTVMLGVIRFGQASPGDITNIPAPMLGSDPPKAETLRDGDASVSTQTGALQYSYPITVPPGRLGNEPHLALSYSSQAPIFGGIAAGWSLTIPEIRLDTSKGILATHYMNLFGSDGRADDEFISTMAGSRPLVPVAEPTSAGVYKTYRSQNDTSFTRYERMETGQGFSWRAYSPDGLAYYFGDTYLVTGGVTEDHVPLTRTVDQYGNTVEYQWDDLGEYQIKEIRYTSNPAASLPAFAKVDFTWEPSSTCPDNPIGGGQLDYRLGSRHISGQNELATITATAFDPGTSSTLHTRQISLTYNPDRSNCAIPTALKHGPVRYLIGIQESAWGATAPRVDLPKVTFQYGASYSDLTTVDQSYGTWSVNTATQPNLTWGDRYNDTRWPTVREMMVDFDGDGLVDRLYADPSGACQFRWERNTGTGFQSVGNWMPLPQLPRSGSPDEKCSLDGMFTEYVNSSNLGSDSCRPTEGSPQIGSYLGYRWMDLNGDGLPDLVTAIQKNYRAYDPAKTGDQAFPWPSCSAHLACAEPADAACMRAALDCSTEGQACRPDGSAVGACLAQSTPASCYDLVKTPLTVQNPNPSCGVPYVPFQLCDGQFPWQIYWNQGNGHLASTPDIRLEPVPLESDSGDSSAGPGAFSSSVQAFQDIDGDGNIDAIVQSRNGLELSTNDPIFWEVFRGNGHGSFLPEPVSQFPYVWYVPEGAEPQWSTGGKIGTQGDGLNQGVGLMADMNGDGLPDYLWKPNPNTPAAAVFYNMGNQFQFGGYNSTTKTWSYSTALDPQISAFSRSYIQALILQNSGTWISGGVRTGKGRLADIDGDGRVDLFDVPCANAQCTSFSPAVLRTNSGGTFMSSSTPSGNESAALQQQALITDGGPGIGTWAVVSDLADIDGDGMPELVEFDTSGNLYRLTQPKTDQPLRLMNHVDNGRGLTVSVHYAPSTQAATVTQDPTTRRASPHIQWVVKSMTSTDQFASTSSTTSYHYDYPHWGPDELGRYGFRGFDAVHTFSPTSAETLQRYGYDVDWSGRLTSTLTFPAETPGLPLSISDTTWIAKTLFAGLITTYHAQTARQWKCANGQTEAQCRATPAGFTKQDSTWAALASTTATGGPTLLWQETGKTLQDSETFDAGDRRTDTTYALDADATTYRLRDLSEVSKQQVGGSLSLYARNDKTYDTTYRLPATDEVYFDNVGNNRAVTSNIYDSAGNLATLIKPLQRGTSKKTTYTYDSRKLFVDTATNELNQSVQTTFDYGTGAALRTIGPNGKSCTGTCNTQTKEGRRTDVDGLGRPVAEWVTINTTTGDFQMVQVGKSTYVDSTATAPASVQVESLIEYDDTRWSKEKTDLDGHGRPIRKTSFVQGTAPADAISTFTYDALGKLVGVTVPDPSQNTASTVLYTYGYDSLGRPKSMRRPGATPQSGLDVTYSGLVETKSEVAGIAGGPVGVTETTDDAFGRLTLVREQLSSGWAATTYHYDPSNNIDVVTDPDGLVTTLDHDFASRRVAIHRGARTWSYGYDKNGNLISEASPAPSPALLPLYTTTYAYDDLDRVSSRLVGTRGMSQADLDLLGVGQLVYTYDTGTNGIGRLHSVVTKSSSTTPVTALTTTLSYDAEGNEITDNRVVNLGGVTGNFTRSATFAPSGKLRLLTYGDGTTATTSTQSRTFYDNRSLPSKLDVTRPGYVTSTYGAQTRNVAGLVLKRESALGGFLYDSNWIYDPIGRITSLQVLKSNSPVASQTFNYFGLDDPSTMSQFYPASSVPPTPLQKTFAYTYDSRHQLAGVTEAGSAFTGTYAFKNSGRFDRVTVNAAALPGSDVKNRDVYYEYNASDPEAVSRLRKASDSTDFATYQYDTVGNQIARTYASPAQSWTYAYDGDDQLRRSILTGGNKEEYYYDHTGSRIGIVKRSSAGAITEVRYFIGGDAEIWLSPTGTVNQTYAYVSLGTPVARISNRGPSELEFHSPLSNLLATVETTSGTTTTAFVYGPYSELVQTYQGTAPGDGNSNCTIGNLPCHRRRFNDKYVDEVDSLSYYGVRYYDSVSMTWTQADPGYRFAKDAASTEPRRANLYDFDLHNPIRFVDPDGRNPAAALAALCDGPQAVGCAAVGVFAIFILIMPSHPCVTAGCPGQGAGSYSPPPPESDDDSPAEPKPDSDGSGAGSGADSPAPTPQPTPPSPGPSLPGDISPPSPSPQPTDRRQSPDTLRKKWEEKNQRPWPKDPDTGKNQDISHKIPVADGGPPNDPGNYDPQPHKDHMDDHKRKGDFKRWGERGAKKKKPSSTPAGSAPSPTGKPAPKKKTAT